MAKRLQDRVGRFSWWRYSAYEVVQESDGLLATAWIRPVPGAPSQARLLSVDGEDWAEASRLFRRLDTGRKAFKIFRVEIDTDDLLAWCRRYGLPGTSLMDALEIAFPAVDAEVESGLDAAASDQRIYLKEGGRWSHRLRHWRLPWHPDPENDGVDEDVIWPDPRAAGGVTFLPPGGTTETRSLEWLHHITPGLELAHYPVPLSEDWLRAYREPVDQLVADLAQFDAAVCRAAEEGDSTALDQYLAGCSVALRRDTDGNGCKRWLQQWTVSSLWAGLALQAMHHLTASRAGICPACKCPFARRRPNAKWCSDKCSETGKKRAQRKRKKAAAARLKRQAPRDGTKRRRP